MSLELIKSYLWSTYFVIGFVGVYLGYKFYIIREELERLREARKQDTNYILQVVQNLNRTRTLVDENRQMLDKNIDWRLKHVERKLRDILTVVGINESTKKH